MNPIRVQKTETPLSEDWLNKTNLFQHWHQKKKDIGTHKWYESEKAGHDIGWERATIDYLIRHDQKKAD